ncbi:hypothetical protein FHS07_001994 [Microbacterium proteolyticum]|uniref:Uncharacterized protein n=1 Tax=Microbacterium proteolyticum TaxID=1572644 RepID=A0A7W5CIF1_9MICO|nr:hypothetical protein [Microbacterium proteolyticum]MBB3158298.1 hypothetical protein [Microbacterium proteolyticum]
MSTGRTVIRRDPFASRTRRPKHLADASGAIAAADEIAELNRLAAAEWIWRHDLDLSVGVLLARIAEVGTDVATAEALAGRLPTRRAQ